MVEGLKAEERSSDTSFTSVSSELQSCATKLKCEGWTQQGPLILFILRSDESLETSDISGDFHPSSVTLFVKGTRDWHCSFSEKICSESTRVIVSDNKVYITLTKAEPEVIWTELTATQIPQCEASNKSANLEMDEEALLEDSVHVLDLVQHDYYEKVLVVKCRGISVHRAKCPATGIIYLNNWHNKTYHKILGLQGPDNEKIVLNIYVKSVIADSVDIEYGKQDIVIRFSTRDAKFLKLHSKSRDDAVFQWSLNLLDQLNKEDCSFSVRSTKIEISLRKLHPKHWGRLEPAPNSASGQKPAGDWSSLKTCKRSTPSTPVTPRADGASGSDAPTTESCTLTNKNERHNFTDDKPAKSKKVSTSKGWYADALTTAKTTESVPKETPSNKPTCKVSPYSKYQNISRSSTSDSLSGLSSGISTGISTGLTGLDNLGNTCFMNSVIQVLVNTRVLRDYFLESRFQHEINSENPLGTGGKLAVAFGVLTRMLWCGMHRSYAPHKLKNLVAQRNSQFTGYAQHDAQEFMAFLLDGLHEDVNRIRKKPYTQAIEDEGRPDADVAAASWQIHKLRNDSFIVDHFQGQFKSKLVCPSCSKISITFDPYMIVSVPLPKQQRSLPVIFLSKDPRKKPQRFVVQIAKDASSQNLMEEISKKTNVHTRNMRVFEEYGHKIHKFYDRHESLKQVLSTDHIYVNELLSERMAGETVIQIMVLQRLSVPQSAQQNCSLCFKECQEGEKLRRCSRCFKTAYCNQSCQKDDWQKHKNRCIYSPELVGHPYIISLPKSQTTYANIAQAAYDCTRWSVDVFQPPVNNDNSTCTNINDSEHDNANDNENNHLNDQNTLLPDSLDNQLDNSMCSEPEPMQTDESSSCSSSPSSSSAENSEKNSPTYSGSDKLPTQYVIARLQQSTNERTGSLFTLRPVNCYGQNFSGPNGEALEDLQDEPLPMNKCSFLSLDWKSDERTTPHCFVNSKAMEFDDESSGIPLFSEDQVTLQQCLKMFTEPEILSKEHAWYCPHCKEHRQASKQMSLWSIPDILSIQLKRFSFKSLLWRDKIDKMVEFPIRDLDMSPFLGSACGPGEAIYDLYSVINHHGNILGGHYTAYGCCSDDGEGGGDNAGWRLFDDSIVTPVTEREVMTRDAYVLFYKRRQTAPKIPATIDVSAQESQDCENSFEKMDASKPEDFEMTSADNYEAEKCKEVVCRKYEGNDTHDDEVKHKLKLQKDYVDKTNISNSLICEQYTDMDSID